MKKVLAISIFLFIIIFALVNFVPWEKYQNKYFDIINEFRSKPQQHFDKQIEYAKYVQENGKMPDLYKKSDIKTHIPVKKQKKEKEQKRKPLYIRDKNNPNILHPYKERKFLFFRFYIY